MSKLKELAYIFYFMDKTIYIKKLKYILYNKT